RTVPVVPAQAAGRLQLIARAVWNSNRPSGMKPRTTRRYARRKRHSPAFEYGSWDRSSARHECLECDSKSFPFAEADGESTILRKAAQHRRANATVRSSLR